MAATTRASEDGGRIRRHARAVANGGDDGRVDEFVAGDARDRTPLGGRDALVGTAGERRTAVPGSAVTLEGFVAGGDAVAVRVRRRGTRGGAFVGVPPTGRSADVGATAVLRAAVGRTVERRTRPDPLGLPGVAEPPARPGGGT